MDGEGRMPRDLAFWDDLVGRGCDGIIGLDEAGQVVFINLEACRLLGCSPADLIDGAEASRPLSGRPSDRSVNSSYAGGLAERFLDGLLIHHDGRCFRVAYEIAPIVDRTVAGRTVVRLREMRASAIAGRRAEVRRAVL